MEFYTQNGGKRPIRLSETTRKFAYDSLGRKYGLDTLRVNSVFLDNIENFSDLSFVGKYDVAISKIAKEAPIRICEGERISGAATLGMAVGHNIPATYGGRPLCSSISHLTVNFEEVLKEGINGIRRKAEKPSKNTKIPKKRNLQEAALTVLMLLKFGTDVIWRL